MKPPITTTCFAASEGMVCCELLVGLREQRGGLRMATIRDDHVAGIDDAQCRCLRGGTPRPR